MELVRDRPRGYIQPCDVEDVLDLDFMKLSGLMNAR